MTLSFLPLKESKGADQFGKWKVWVWDTIIFNAPLLLFHTYKQSRTYLYEWEKSLFAGNKEIIYVLLTYLFDKKSA